MKLYKRRIEIIGLWVISVVISFFAGMLLIYEYYIFGDPVSEVSTLIDVHPLFDGPLYEVQDFVRANDDVKEYLSQQRKNPEFYNLQPRFIVAPEMSGYTIYASSGRRGTDFPKELFDSAREVMKISLGKSRATPPPPEPK